ncbi:MAG: ABC transporter permease [Gemmatimonadota bacterium]|nr:ABC transporter permease [Gemmatimonadota bacterium]
MKLPSRLELSIAWRYLRSRRGSRLLSFISVIAVAGVAVAVSALIVIIGVVNGLQTDLREKILVGSPDVRVMTYGDALRMEGWQDALPRVSAVPGVLDAAPFVNTQGLATLGRGYESAVIISGIPAGDSASEQVTTIRDHAAPGAFQFRASDGSRRGAVLGKRLAGRLGAIPGSRLTIVTAAGGASSPLFGGMMPRFYDFEVTGEFETGMYEYDDNYVFLELEAARELAGLDSAVTGIEVKTADRWIAPDVAAAIDSVLGYPYRTVDWQEQNSGIFRALKLEKLGMAVVLGLIIMVAAFNIVSTLTMVVRDKTREIGILRAMGMRADAIRRIFLLQGLFIGVVGTGMGLVLGVLAGVALDTSRLIALDPSVYFIDHLPVQMQVMDIAWIVAASVAVSVLATLHPAVAASKLFPIEAIRSE